MPGKFSKYLLIAVLAIVVGLAAFYFLCCRDSLDRARAFIDAGEVAAAEAMYARLLTSDEHAAEAAQGLGNIALQRGDLAGAEAFYLQSLELKHDAVTLNNLGLLELKRGDAAAALMRFAEAEAADPDSSDAFYNAGLLLQADGEPGLALAKFSEALTVNPDHTMARYRRACLLLAMDETAMAISEFESLDETQPEFLPARADLGYALLQDGRPGEAREQFEAAIAANAEFDRAHYGLGIVRVQLMDYAGAAESFRRASEIDPANAAYRADMAFCIYLKGEPGAAAACQSHLYDALKLEPHNPRAVKLAAAFYDAEFAVYSEVSDE